MTVDARIRPTPRWKMVFNDLQEELQTRRYGSDFYSIAEVCRKFEVSQITAIRVLNELASRHLIEKIAGKGNIVRRVDVSFPIWLVTPDAARGSYGGMDSGIRRRVEGVTRAAQQLGLPFDFISESRMEQLLTHEHGRAGFILPHQIARQTYRFLRDHRLPYVSLDAVETGATAPCARVDRVLAGRLATRHLLDLGHRRIAWITGLLCRRNFRDRVRGYRDALRAAGVPFRWSLIQETDTRDAPAVHAALRRILDHRHPPTAVIMGDDSRAIDVLDACRKLNVDVPGRLNVVGYPNDSESRLTSPPLTVVDACFEKVGEAAVRLLMEQVLSGADPKSQRVWVDPELIVRGSTGPAPQTRKPTESAPLETPSISKVSQE